MDRIQALVEQARNWRNDALDQSQLQTALFW
jgi:hypothetical protein